MANKNLLTIYACPFFQSETEWSSKSTTMFARHVEEIPLIARPCEIYGEKIF